MSALSESFVLAKTRSQDLNSVRRLNCWGNEFKDISLVRRMINLEILCLSLNQVTTLEDIGCCVKLRELIIRKNHIKNMSEILHLQKLPHLEVLWLDENPCAEETPNYRKVVLRTLPNLKVLDNIPVGQDELRMIEELGDEIYDEIARQESVHYEEVQQPTAEPDLLPKSREESLDHNPNISSLNLEDCYSERETCGSASQTNNRQQHQQQQQQQFREHQSMNLSQHNQSWSQQSLSQHNTSLNNNTQVLPKGGKSRCANILSAVLCLIRELDYVSCEIVRTELNCRIESLL